MTGQQQSLDFGNGVYDGGADILAAEKRRNTKLKQARQANASAQTLAQVQAGLDVVLERLATNNPAPKTTVTVAATIDQLAAENKTLKAVNLELQTQCIALRAEIIKLKSGIK